MAQITTEAITKWVAGKDLTEVINNYAKGLTTKEQTVEIVEGKINEELLA